MQSSPHFTAFSPDNKYFHGVHFAIQCTYTSVYHISFKPFDVSEIGKETGNWFLAAGGVLLLWRFRSWPLRQASRATASLRPGTCGVHNIKCAQYTIHDSITRRRGWLKFQLSFDGECRVLIQAWTVSGANIGTIIVAKRNTLSSCTQILALGASGCSNTTHGTNTDIVRTYAVAYLRQCVTETSRHGVTRVYC